MDKADVLACKISTAEFWINEDPLKVIQKIS